MTTKPSESEPSVTLSILVLIGFLAVVFIFAAAGGNVTASSVQDWYPTLNKPPLTPPNWVFAPVWTFLFFLMGVSAWLVWRKAGGLRQAHAALPLFFAQLGLNLGWSVSFFGMRNPAIASIEIVFLLAMILATILVFASIERLAAILMLPYLAWTSFATYLTFAIWWLN
ncbi:MAG: tryptophan-rich sensory protein [Rhizobiales bacterium]|nr:tryptophan-rich sensory protein [Hyphomicrobiales bacterium]